MQVRLYLHVRCKFFQESRSNDKVKSIVHGNSKRRPHLLAVGACCGWPAPICLCEDVKISRLYFH